MEQAESSPKFEENEHAETNVDSESTAPFAIGKSDKENEIFVLFGHHCSEWLSPAVDPLQLAPGPGGEHVANEQYVTHAAATVCHTLLRRWYELQPETNHRLRSRLRVQSNPSTDNVVTIEISDEEDEVLQQRNTETRVVDDAETALGDTLQKGHGKPQSAYDLVIKEKNDVTLALSSNKLDMDGRDVMQENLSEDMTTDNVLERWPDDESSSRNGDEEMVTCAVKEKNIALDDVLHGGNFSKDVMPIVDIPEQHPGNKDLNERVVNENSKSTVHPDREINVHTLHLSEDKPEAEVRRDKSKLLHVPEQEICKNNPKKRNLKSFNADHLIIKKKRISNKKQNIHTEREFVVRYENISTSRDHVKTRVERTRNNSIQLNHSNYIPGSYNIAFDPAFQAWKDYYVRKSINVKSYKGFRDNSKKVSKNNNFNMTLNIYEDLDEGYRLFSSPKQTLIGDYLIHEDEPGLENNDNKGNARAEVDLIGDENNLSPESNILRELQEVDISNVETIIDFDSDTENPTIKGIAGDVNKNSTNRVIKTYSAFRRNTTQGKNETKNIGTHDNRKNSSIVNVNDVIKTYEGYNCIRKRKSCESKHDISKQDSAVTNKNASSKSTENDAKIPDPDGDNAKGCNKNYGSHNNKPGKRQQNESSKDLINLLRDHNYVDVNRRSSCSSTGTGTDNAEAAVAVDATDFSAPAPKSVKKRKARKMLLHEGRNGSSRLTKKVELPDIEEVRRLNRNMLTAQVTPITQCQGDLNTSSCDHGKSPNMSSSAASFAGCSRCAAAAAGADGRRARCSITTISKKREYILNKVKRKPIIVGAKPYRRKRRRRRPRFKSPDNVSNDDENMPTRDLILENEEATRSNNPVSHSKTITSESNDTPSILNEGWPTHSLATHHKEHDTIVSSNPVADFKSVPSNGACSTPIESVPPLSLSTAQKEQDTARSFNPLANLDSAQNQSSNDALAALIEDCSTQHLTTVQKEQELTRSFDPVAGFESVAPNRAPSVLTEGMPEQNFTTVQREQKTTRHSNVVTQSEPSNALIECVSPQNLSRSRKERKRPRVLKRDTFNIPMHVTAIQKERKKSSVNPLKLDVKPRRKRKLPVHRSESPDDASSVPVPIYEGVSMRELTTTQSNQETNACHRNSVPSNTAPSISNEGLPTQGLTVACYSNTRTYGFIAPSSSSARDPSVLSKNVLTRDVITTLNNHETATKPATRIESVPSTPSLIHNKLATCKRSLLLPTASLNERRNSVDSMLHVSKHLTEKVKACEERKQQKQSSKSGFKPLLFRKGSFSKNALLKGDFASLHEEGTTNFSNAKGNEIERLGITKVTSSCDSMLANNGTTLISTTLPISTQTNLENQNNSLEPFSEIASDNSVPNVAELNQLLSSPEVVDAPRAECVPVIVNVQSLAPLQELTNERNLRTSASESTVQVADSTNNSLPVISLKQAKPVCVSYQTNPLREIHDLTSDPKAPKEVTQQLPKIINVTSYTNKQVNQSTREVGENNHNLAATLKRTIPLSEQVTSPMTTHMPKAIRESDVQPSQQIDRSESLAPEPIQPKALSKITLKRAQPVYASYHPPNEMEVLISDPREEGPEMHLPRVGDVAGDLHVMQPDDRMGLHLVVSQDEVCNDSLTISQFHF